MNYQLKKDRYEKCSCVSLNLKIEINLCIHLQLMRKGLHHRFFFLFTYSYGLKRWTEPETTVV